MLISRISGCKGTILFVLQKVKSLLFVIYFAKPFFQFAGPLAFVGKRVAESPSVSADRVGVQAGWNLALDQCQIVVHTVGYGYGTVVAAVHDKGRRGLRSDLQFVGIFLFECLRRIFPNKLS